jgi:hypothetical protein
MKGATMKNNDLIVLGLAGVAVWMILQTRKISGQATTAKGSIWNQPSVQSNTTSKEDLMNDWWNAPTSERTSTSTPQLFGTFNPLSEA